MSNWNDADQENTLSALAGIRNAVDQTAVLRARIAELETRLAARDAVIEKAFAALDAWYIYGAGSRAHWGGCAICDGHYGPARDGYDEARKAREELK